MRQVKLNQIAGIETFRKFENKGKGNPYHDELGKFTTGPSTAFGEFKGSNDLVYGPQADYKGVSFEDAKEAPYRPFMGEVGLGNNEFLTSMSKENADATLQTIAALRNVKSEIEKRAAKKETYYATDPLAQVESGVADALQYAYSVGYRSSHEGQKPDVREYSPAARNNKDYKEIEYHIDRLKKLAKNKDLEPLAKAALAGITTMKYIEDNTDFKATPKIFAATKKEGLQEVKRDKK